MPGNLILKKPNKNIYQPVSLGGCVQEQLPLPFVYYPRQYGTFFTFSESKDGSQFLCDCSQSAIENYLELRSIILSEFSEDDRNGIEWFDRNYLPSYLNLGRITNKSKIYSQLNFRRAICHRCNLKPPELRYCHEMYGGAFVQHFGWYINQTYLKFGILKSRYLKNITPDEYIVDLANIQLMDIELAKEMKWFTDRQYEDLHKGIRNPQPPRMYDKTDYSEVYHHQDLLREATKKARQAKRILSTKIENIVREEFGLRKIGEQWVNETILFQIIKSIFPDQEIFKHFRPAWLNKLELDIYLPTLKLGIEYQGQQHYHAIPVWGGLESLSKLQARDALKLEYCNNQEVELILVDYTEPLTIEYIKSRIPSRFWI